MSKELSKDLDRELREIGDVVAQEARALFSDYDARSAMGFRSRTRGFGRVEVEQRRRKTTGQHPEFGSLQMRKALLPARARKRDEIYDRVDRMLGRLGGDYGF